jgi:hypothetical protein
MKWCEERSEREEQAQDTSEGGKERQQPELDVGEVVHRSALRE